jgi:hypothetical protein
MWITRLGGVIFAIPCQIATPFCHAETRWVAVKKTSSDKGFLAFATPTTPIYINKYIYNIHGVGDGQHPVEVLEKFGMGVAGVSAWQKQKNPYFVRVF